MIIAVDLGCLSMGQLMLVIEKMRSTSATFTWNHSILVWMMLFYWTKLFFLEISVGLLCGPTSQLYYNDHLGLELSVASSLDNAICRQLKSKSSHVDSQYECMVQVPLLKILITIHILPDLHFKIITSTSACLNSANVIFMYWIK